MNARTSNWIIVFVTAALLALVVSILVPPPTDASQTAPTDEPPRRPDFTAPEPPPADAAQTAPADEPPPARPVNYEATLPVDPVQLLLDVEEHVHDNLIGTNHHTLEQLFYAVRMRETPGEEDPINALGDNGGSLGPYQISRGYFQDALEQDTGLAGTEYDEVRQPLIAQLVMLTYWERYANDDLQTVRRGQPGWREAAVRLGRIHNGGPDGATEPETVDYGNSIRRSFTK